ncbi:MAG: RagB/SusD family nutrient uptake outer membrane protein, partial [Bacteroidota bacterium]|nr:RagB/SusD family nutrient uptake outer membrane protein [Bacteroidota bacterium]
TEPILTVKQSQKQYPVYTMEELAPVLIADLEPWKDEEYPEIEMNGCFYPIRFLLGDLHLWLGEYEQAATEYHDLMYDKKYTVSSYYRSYRKVLNNAFTQSFVHDWNYSFSLGSSECITFIPASNQYERHFTLDSLVLDYKIAASQLAVDNWNAQVYYYSSTLDTLGDLRIDGSVLALKKGYSFSDTYGNNITNNSSTDRNYLYKFIEMNNPSVDTRQVMTYRIALLYLRYAEAVNRLGKPNLAMAAIKNGLNRINLSSAKIVPASEKGATLPAYMNFNDIRFDGNIGVRARGCGNVGSDTTKYIIPKCKDLPDSIVAVEDMIINETALETAFEGNRFQDLMRIAIRRNDNSFLADKVAAKHKTNATAIKSKLMTRSNWYLPN